MLSPAGPKPNVLVHVDDIQHQPIRRRHAIDGRVRSGCLTCKARKKKCDQQYTFLDGRCKSCARLGLVCSRTPLQTVQNKMERRKNDTRKELGSFDGMYAHLPSPPIWLSPPLSNEGDESNIKGSYCAPGVSTPFAKLPSSGNGSLERILLKYYMERLSPLCSILQDASSGFCNVLLPMAMEDASLLHALFAYASGHFPAIEKQPYIDPQARLRFESKAARGLSQAIRRNTISESTIACALISSTSEVVRGDTKQWYIHLQGAGHLIEHLGPPERLRQTSDGSFLLLNFVYHDIMSALTTGCRPRFCKTSWMQADAYASADCLMGVAHEIVGCISELCVLIADANGLDASSSDASDILRNGHRLGRLLRSSPLRPTTNLSNTNLELLIHHAEGFRFAALVHLYQFLSRLTTTTTAYRARISECVKELKSHLLRVPFDSYCEIGLAFPLFMAGLTAADESDCRDYVRDRLDHIQGWTGFKHTARARDLLEYLWAAGRTDWQTVLQEWDWKISLA